MNRYIDYKTIFSLYKLKRKSQDDKRRIRRNLRNYFDKYIAKLNAESRREYELWHSYNTDEEDWYKTWNDLSIYQKDYFIYYDIKKLLLKEVEISEKREINNQLYDYVQKHMIEGDANDAYARAAEDARRYANHQGKRFEMLAAYNRAVFNIHDKPESKNISKREKKEAYEKLREAFQEYNKSFPIPTYEYYAKCPLSIYDYVRSYDDSGIKWSDITPTLLRIILHVLESELGLSIDYYGILNCYERMRSIEYKDIYPHDLRFDAISIKDTKPERLDPLEQYFKNRRMIEKLTPFYNLDKSLREEWEEELKEEIKEELRREIKFNKK